MNFLNFIKPLYYEFLAKFVPQKVRYKRYGECIKCAKCCRYMYCKDLGSEREFRFLQVIYPEYRKFKIQGKDENGNYVIACSLIDKDNLCPIYPKILNICRKYPAPFFKSPGILHKDCGFYIKPEKTFKYFLGK